MEVFGKGCGAFDGLHGGAQIGEHDVDVEDVAAGGWDGERHLEEQFVIRGPFCFLHTPMVRIEA